MHIDLNNIATLVAIILGSGGISGGTFRAARGLYNKARAAEQLRDAIVQLLDNHEKRIAAMEALCNPTPPQAPPNGPPLPAPMLTRGRPPGTRSR